MSNQKITVTINPELLSLLEKYCSVHYISRSAAISQAILILLEKDKKN